MRRRRWWLVAAFALLLVAAWLMSGGERVRKSPARPQVNFPTELRPTEVARLEKRRTLPPAPVAPPVAVAPGAPTPLPVAPLQRDPLLTSLPSKENAKGTALVIEGSAFVHSPIGELVLNCLRTAPDDPLSRLQREFGLDLSKDLDRVAMTEDALAITGHLEGLNRAGLASKADHQTHHGESGEIYEFVDEDENPDGTTTRTSHWLATWKDEFVVTAESEAAAKGFLDRLEGREAPGTPLIPESETYGDLYGVMSGEDLAELIPEDQPQLRDLALNAATRATLHADATRDFAITASVDGQDSDQLRQLGRSLGAALSVARLAAKARGEDDVSDLLSFARAAPGDEQLELDMAIPYEWAKTRLEKCGQRKRALGD